MRELAQSDFLRPAVQLDCWCEADLGTVHWRRPALNALISGQVDYMCDGGALNSVPHEQSGRIKAHVIDAERRNFPPERADGKGTRPLSESKGVDGFVCSQGDSIGADKLTEALDRALDEDQTRKRMLDNATEIPDRADRGNSSSAYS